VKVMDTRGWFDGAAALRDLEMLARVVLAVALSVPLGWDRERQKRPAGLRTHMLVAASSATFMILGELMVTALGNRGDSVQMDPLRSLEAVVTGLGFLAAGTIFRAEGTVQGITTAASIWVTAAVALCVGHGRYVLGIGLTILAVLVLVVLQKLTLADSARVETVRTEEEV
jgi:putative Mg2+ transporter-C (MgtC) family protein